MRCHEGLKGFGARGLGVSFEAALKLALLLGCMEG